MCPLLWGFYSSLDWSSSPGLLCGRSIVLWSGEQLMWLGRGHINESVVGRGLLASGWSYFQGILLLPHCICRPHVCLFFPFCPSFCWHSRKWYFSDYSAPTAVTMEPFSTLVFKVLTWISATTTKIRTRGHFTQHHCQGFFTDLHTCLLINASL
jgi:hypothetical protein